MRIKRNETNELAPIQIGVAGSIAIGMKNPDKGYPMALDYFRVRTENKEYEKMFIEQIGEKPNTLKICFVSESEEENCNQYLELRDSAGKRCAYSDGYDYYVLHNSIYVKRSNEEIIAQYKTIENWEAHLINNVFKIQKDRNGKEASFREKLEIKFALVNLKGLYAIWKFSTHGNKSSIGQIVSTYDNTKNMLGRISMVTFDLCVKKVKSDKAGDNRSYPVVSLIPNLSPNSMNVLHDYLSNGNEIRGIITEQSVNNLQPKLLTTKPN